MFLEQSDFFFFKCESLLVMTFKESDVFRLPFVLLVMSLMKNTCKA